MDSKDRVKISAEVSLEKLHLDRVDMQKRVNCWMIKSKSESFICLKGDHIKFKFPADQACSVIRDISSYWMLIHENFDELKNTLIEIASDIEQKADPIEEKLDNANSEDGMTGQVFPTEREISQVDGL